MSKVLKIVSIVSEIDPFSKSGGLADVARSLPKAIKRLGHDVIAITPLYGKIIDKKKYDLKLIYENVDLYINSEDVVRVNYWQGYMMEGLSVYFMECPKYFSKRKTLYGSSCENKRWMIFDVAALKLISLLKFNADIVHCHDWQTGLIPFYLKTKFRYSKTLSKAKTIFTIHNLIFQLGKNWWEVPLKNKDYGHKRLPHFSNPDLENINFAKRAILSADVISAVSEKYRDELMTRQFGQDLHQILRNRKDRLFGIVNGIDYKSFNPNNDPGLFRNYNCKKIHRKKLNKEYVQKKFCLPVNPDIPLVCTTSRITFQKGLALVSEIAEELMNLDMQLIMLGDGDKNYIKELKRISRKYPKKFIWIPFTGNAQYETLLYAGADFFLLPSHYEPCGINQLKAMRYGCIPIVRRVGGLHDTVIDFDPTTCDGTGFVFEKFNKFSMYRAIVRALENFHYKDVWKNMILRAMQESNSWEIPAKKYVTLYKKALRVSDLRPRQTKENESVKNK
ncbi:hypothetical protein A2331_05325 [Candidatus Falkowbacteria bacterium RIFOXYB2_FULL_34_18]|uniref:Glycogen synthase n=1 Tax=Candidatus Falkowbacteria bacterium RIFOXYD2_FULL_34_120 TaxID=1798007 RepID=A0A1F5TRM7_9BACT|nr:MAG: hypothetical protein A2331_05325 [Candidatus Falkowbacteria bacterium RIFOXYB2_FULL_34_18]OGF29476.1 MAG: hypothetical protein A2500_04190 [Candidatus Falkowbacteria bacterium RIFOXYC12_FULL_34_55]OGF36293.1 MAG: hypothetical protein A2466_05200 [Candidatus Falkowbacteria bacterium RIFOXYC2_FULL_34_220]OGF39002.1 MAG: hypothetical protein A2515_06655 [Candidatus Falkowbacteria bacterium RIFOXYD12_FULL_34_57]OGF41221.1 MAG: hypothetical protein A2531_00895 [Candidatus Falkowbacteria bact